MSNGRPLTRRAALKVLGATGVGAVTGGISYGFAIERHRIRLFERPIAVTGLPPALNGLRVGLITDLHLSAMVPAEDIRTAVTLLRDTRPDLVALGGDYVTDADTSRAGPVAELMAPLADAPAGSFAVLGNHDDDRIVPAALAAKGFAVLRDQRTRITVRGEPLDIVGLRYWTRRLADVTRVVKDAGPTTLMLAHDPRRLTEAAMLDVQLVLSGHTHGGQVVLPGAGAIAARRFPVVAGEATDGNCRLFVSRGVGTVFAPVRINCPPEVTVLVLQSTGKV